MDLIKSQWTTDGDNYSVNMPLTKIDKENRLVSGWASLDNADQQGDVVTKEASESAFSKFRGNIREMHQPIAVGRMIDWRPETYFDEKTHKFYNGIFVTAYISKGAQATWEKVLDGTLQAFSVKGPIKDSYMEFSKDAGRPLRVVKSYEMEELSLVDSGGNELANVVSIQKSVDGSYVVKGMVAETKTENVFYCTKHDEALTKTSTEDSAACPEGHSMQNIGWFEYDDGADRVEKVQGLISRYHSSNTNSAGAGIAKQVEPAINEGGVEVAEETETPEAGTTVPAEVDAGEQGKAQTEVDASVTTEETNTETATEEETAPQAADVSEVEADEPNFAKMFGDLQAAIESKLQKVATDTENLVGKVNEVIEAKVSELTKRHDELAQNLEGFKTSLGSVETTVKSLESGTAIKKSSDLGGSPEDSLEKSNKESMWGGHFLSATDLQN